MVVTILNGLALAALLYSMAAGFSLIFGTMKVINLAHGSLYLLGAVIGVRLMREGTLTSLLLAVVVAVVVGTLVGVLLWAMLQPLRSSGFFPQALLTIAISFLAADGLAKFQDGKPTSVDPPAPLDGSVTMLGVDFPVFRLALIGFGVLLVGLLLVTIERSKLGLRLQAATVDPAMARAMGINVRLVTAGVFCFGSVIAVLGGTVGAPLMGAATGTDHRVLLLALVVVVLGGLGSVSGAAIGAVVVGLLQTVGVALVPEITPYLLFGAMLVVLVIRPGGLLGKARGEAGRLIPETAAIRQSWLPQPASRMGWGVGGVVLLFLVSVPLISGTFYTSEVGLVLAFGALAVTFDMVLGIAGLAAFNHVVYFGLGAYLTTILANDGTTNAVILAGIAGVAAAAMAAAISWLPLRARAITFVMVTLAIGQLAQTIAENLKGVTGGTDGVTILADLEVVPGMALDDIDSTYWYVLAGAAFIYLCLRFVSTTPYGRALRGIRDNEERMSALGYNTSLYKYFALVLTGGFAGIAGALWVTQTRYVAPTDLGFAALAFLLMVVVVGGVGSLWGPFAGATVVFFTRDVVAADYYGWGPVILGLVMVAVVYLAPGGIASLRLRLPRQRRRSTPSSNAPAPHGVISEVGA